MCSENGVWGPYISWRFDGRPCMGELFFCLIPWKWQCNGYHTIPNISRQNLG